MIRILFHHYLKFEIIGILRQNIVYSDKWLDNTLMLRYDTEVIVYEKEGCIL